MGFFRDMKNRLFGNQPSDKMSSMAGRVLSDPDSTPQERSLAASLLAQDETKGTNEPLELDQVVSKAAPKRRARKRTADRNTMSSDNSAGDAALTSGYAIPVVTDDESSKSSFSGDGGSFGGGGASSDYGSSDSSSSSDCGSSGGDSGGSSSCD